MKICLDYFILKNSKSLLFTHKQARVEFCHCRDSILAFTLEDDIYIDI